MILSRTAASALMVAICSLTLGASQREAFTIKFSTATEGGNLSGKLEQTFEAPGETTPVKATAKNGYMFNYWIVDGKPLTQEQITLKAVANKEVKAYFVRKTASTMEALAPNVRGINNLGEPMALSNHYGKVMLLNVLAEYCDLCADKAVIFEGHHKALKSDQFTCVTLMHSNNNSGKPKKETLQNWVNKYGTTMPIQNDNSGTKNGYAYSCFVKGSDGAPCYIVINKDFRIAHLGNEMEPALEAAKALLQESNPPVPPDAPVPPAVRSEGPKVVENPQSQTVKEGETVTFTIKYTPPTDVKVHWMKIINEDEDCEELSLDPEKFVIENVQKTHAGTYRTRLCSPNGCTMADDFTLTVE